MAGQDQSEFEGASGVGTVPAPPLPALDPCARIPTLASRSADAMAGPVLFDCSRSIVYVRSLDWTPHGWGLVKWYAPDVAGVVLLVTVIAAVVRCRRILRSPQGRDAWYCRRCNYQLGGPDVRGAC